MKKHIQFQVALFVLSFATLAQSTDCNRAVWIKQDAKYLPKEVCIPKGYLISNIYEPTDVNGDSLPDVIFKWRKPELCDGDTFYVTMYLQKSDSSFSYFRTFNNLYPINFKNYSIDYVPKEDKLKGIHRKYYGFDPLIELAFEKGRIKITRKEDAEANLIITYKFDNAINNWRYEKSEEYFLIVGGYKPIDLSEELGPTIDNFTYFY